MIKTNLKNPPHIQIALERAGLTPAEVNVYLYLLKEGLSTPRQISHGTGVARTNVYNVLRDLDDMDLVGRRKRHGKMIYVAENPDAVVHSVEKKKNAIEHILPELQDLYKLQRNKPVVRYFHGLDEIENIFLETLEVGNGGEIFGIESEGRLTDVDEKFLVTKYNKELKNRKIFSRDLLTHDSGIQAAKKTKEYLRAYYDFRMMPKETKDYPAQVLIWGNKVGHVILSEPYFGTVIEDVSLAGLMKSTFLMAWEVGKRS